MNRFRKILAVLLLLTIILPDAAFSFCGFYVARADATLFNETSQVILVRDGDQTTITMLNDFKGEASDFAMVVPVPVVLKRDQIKTLSPDLFKAFDDYSGPRLVDYYDSDPCGINWKYKNQLYFSSSPGFGAFGYNALDSTAIQNQVKIEATYQVGEYDILILSAEESGGLERWLLANDYKIPAGAKEVLEPYIQSQMKFFVVKVNPEQLKAQIAASGSRNLNPLQISFNSSKFMLPIRLGMANANGDQDLIIYTLTRHGRVEPTNYRLAKLPTDKKVPEFITKKFGKFYHDLFAKAWSREGKASLMLEYAWDISGTQSVKCDPCPSPPLTFAQAKSAGVTWVTGDGWSNSYVGPLFFTRIHARYNRSLYPQDFVFMETPNKENFQARYVMTHPASSRFDCDNAGNYIEEVIYRRREELNNLAYLTGWDIAPYDAYVKEYELKYKNVTGYDFTPVPTLPFGGNDDLPRGPVAPQTSPFTLLFVFALGASAAYVLTLSRRKLTGSNS